MKNEDAPRPDADAGRRHPRSPTGEPSGSDPSVFARRLYRVSGTIQGVGFRPAVYRAAVSVGAGGWVQNRSGDVTIALEGPRRTILAALDALKTRLPPGARIESLTLIEETLLPDRTAPGPFRILPSVEDGETRLALATDTVVCRDCLRDVRTPGNRRYGYPFTTCAVCGPRYTVTRSLPFDRARTSLARFALCDECRHEYDHPLDRRFHAQTIACPRCGPRLSLEDARGRPCVGDPLPEARRALAAGAILALQGIGGYALAVDAFNPTACLRLRALKRRPDKPLAVMARHLDVVRSQCRISPAAERALASAAAPIVILDVEPAPGARPLPFRVLSPDTDTLGVMLPTSPLHALLFEPMEGDPTPPFDWLVMTSGNRHSEPIAVSHEEAREKLRGLCDWVLSHDRDILHRNDDSVVAIQGEDAQVWRLGRGLAPLDLPLAVGVKRSALGMGNDERNTVALAVPGRAYVSPHVGNLRSPDGLDFLEETAVSLPQFVRRRPEILAVESHPDMQASLLGRRLAERWGIPCVAVQHHHAHAVACLAEHGLTSGLALVFDGLGYGEDGSLWGAELLHVTPEGYRRLGTFDPAPLPGGDAAVREPLRQLVGRWAISGVEMPADWLRSLGLDDRVWRLWVRQCQSGVLAPRSHAAGRLLDAFAALLGMASGPITYDGQPPVRLEAAASRCGETHLPRVPFEARIVEGLFSINWSPAFALLADRRQVVGREAIWARAVHVAVADAALSMIIYGRDVTGERVVALSGGVFMNRLLTGLLRPRLDAAGWVVAIHRHTPPNDGCVSLGQAVVAGSRSA